MNKILFYFIFIFLKKNNNNPLVPINERIEWVGRICLSFIKRFFSLSVFRNKASPLINHIINGSADSTLKDYLWRVTGLNISSSAHTPHGLYYMYIYNLKRKRKKKKARFQLIAIDEHNVRKNKFFVSIMITKHTTCIRFRVLS